MVYETKVSINNEVQFLIVTPLKAHLPSEGKVNGYGVRREDIRTGGHFLEFVAESHPVLKFRDVLQIHLLPHGRPVQAEHQRQHPEEPEGHQHVPQRQERE